MKILVVSDTHKKNDNYFKVLEQAGPFDMVIHCGDSEGSEYALSAAAECPFEIVAGNNDFFTDLPVERELRIGKYKVLVTHGHHYYVSMGTEMIREEARARGFDVVIYGHTHKPVISYGVDVTVVNPGSISYPRQDGRVPSYMLMELDRFGEMHYTICYL